MSVKKNSLRSNKAMLEQLELKQVSKISQAKKDKIWKEMDELEEEKENIDSYDKEELIKYLSRLIHLRDLCYASFHPIEGHEVDPMETGCSRLDEIIQYVENRINTMSKIKSRK